MSLFDKFEAKMRERYNAKLRENTRRLRAVAEWLHHVAEEMRETADTIDMVLTAIADGELDVAS